MHVSPTAGAAVLLLIAIWPAQSQEVPDLNVDPVCQGIVQQAANPTEKGDPDLTFAECVKSEQSMRQKLVGETNCIGSETGGMASYTDLVSCLEMARAARQLNQDK